ncbi:hypothetical protein, partial [Clostridium perfringens]|uniref:hypothetical protein n=1 Tax=Clostridium perfringens TaxID=1502 RepID=UPI001A9C2442
KSVSDFKHLYQRLSHLTIQPFINMCTFMKKYIEFIEKFQKNVIIESIKNYQTPITIKIRLDLLQPYLFYI